MTSSLLDNIEVIEAGYEFLLAFAAQGRETDRGMEVRETLRNMSDAAAAIAESLAGSLKAGEFAEVIADDVRKSRAAIALVLEQGEISSELVDNLNVSIHLRALLTDLFLLSETRL